MNDINPFDILVSVVVVSYNSEKTIIETLESIKNQTYPKIELIVSDDASSDATVSICQNWIDKNRSRFINVELLSVSKNTGVSENSLRGLRAVNGSWFKFFAADDILLENCIQSFVNFAVSNPEVTWIQSKAYFYNNSFERRTLDIEATNKCFNDDYKKLFSLSAQEQFVRIIRKNFIVAPATFLKTEIGKAFFSNTEKYKYCEDLAFFIKLLSNGNKVYFIDDYLVGYRVSINSLSQRGEKFLFNYKYKKSFFDVMKDMCFPYLSWNERRRVICRFNWETFLELIGLNRYNFFTNFVYRVGLLFCKI